MSSLLILVALGDDLEFMIVAPGVGMGATDNEGVVAVWLPVIFCRNVVMWFLKVVNSDMLALKRWTCSWSSRFSFSKASIRSASACVERERWPS